MKLYEIDDKINKKQIIVKRGYYFMKLIQTTVIKIFL